MYTKLLLITNVDVDVTDCLLITYSAAFVKFLIKNGNTVGQCIRYL